jgi:hypothetical protein
MKDLKTKLEHVKNDITTRINSGRTYPEDMEREELMNLILDCKDVIDGLEESLNGLTLMLKTMDDTNIIYNWQFQTQPNGDTFNRIDGEPFFEVLGSAIIDAQIKMRNY